MNITKCYSLLALWLFWLPAVKAQRPIELTWQEELEYRAGRHYTEEKYYKNGKPDSIYRKLDAKGRKVTEGYYAQGKRHGKWHEAMTMSRSYHYILYTYKYGVLKEIFEYSTWGETKSSPKHTEDHYTLEPDGKNYTTCKIYWSEKHKGKKNDRLLIVRKGIVVHEKIKRWRSSGVEWEQEETKNAYDKNGKNLGTRKHGHWKLWNENGTLQKETWYDMGKKLREKLYDHGKLKFDKKY